MPIRPISNRGLVKAEYDDDECVRDVVRRVTCYRKGDNIQNLLNTENIICLSVKF